MRRARPLAGALLTVLIVAGCGESASTPVGREASAAPSIPPVAASGEPIGPEALAHREVPARAEQPVPGPRFEPALIGDHCTDRDLPAPPAADPVFTILDRSYALPASYVPDDLVPASGAGLTGPSGTKFVRDVVMDDLTAMQDAWQASGLSVIIDSGYRSYGRQQQTFDSWTAQLGLETALVRSARPGHSEHQLGTAIDVSSPGWAGRFGDWALETAEGRWMAAHAWEYGFVMSYPAGSQAVTCFSYEPWHYRWIGRDAAAAQRASGVTLREHLAALAGG
jgi:D-alanyl-D-alanine carboxypeptidase